MSCNNNSYYLDFWEPVSRLWKHKIGLEPHLFFIGESADAPPDYYGKVTTIPPAPEIPIHTQTQWARFYFTKTDLDAVWITSDIDMLPLSPSHFLDSCLPFSDNSLVALNSDMKNYFPVCYNVATGRVFQEIIGFRERFEEDVSNVFRSTRSQSHVVDRSVLLNWSADEIYFSRKLCEFRELNSERVIQLLRPDGYHDGRRINRTNWHYQDSLVLQNWYIDCHSLRPYTNYKDTIERLISISMGKIKNNV